ncbi:MAG: hypothetical protein COT89_02870 [Candidatus Colwellbacteria bacterium CG10_big_fil_rev_8_21_14_0_10_42_22]|uniref:UDP-N-acetylglucosamine--N-acetylmuramyl-(pentapeptide) pyrophosphoryl-undecaprenol N-acetylglucosamine transferase n=1 Tax=Candidatus Colwellbacteria bacterium CG10_big_fil_rev_8_21_14_0_10_42_22 TaxID=1974540 RepID=A0A2H0VFG0_9BACT|nr:MAG: hypothetical protein COT89_02870 [Candidatus Colwellbacteria bacterium CG10_big_fil_rev_8_21_14_0_10_42_22]
MSNKIKNFRVLVTGGGSGGHIYPLAAVVSEIQTLSASQAFDLEVRYIGTCGEFKEYLEQNNIRVQKIVGSKLRRYFSPMNLIDGPKFAWSIFQALWKVYWYMPDVLFSKGGNGSLPVVLASRFYRIPVVIHESDAVPGINNRIASKFADVITVSFGNAAGYFKGKELIHTGGPVRKYLLTDDTTQGRAKGYYGFDINEPLVLVLGGSQGATQINDLVLDTIGDLLGFTQILHQTGKKNHEGVMSELHVALKDLPETYKERYKAIDYFEKDLRIALKAADLVISRAGSGFIFEIAAFGRPSILIPLPKSANNHQEANAIEYQKSGAAMIIEPDNLLPNLFTSNIQKLIQDRATLDRMNKAAVGFYKPEAASNLANIVLRYK